MHKIMIAPGMIADKRPIAGVNEKMAEQIKTDKPVCCTFREIYLRTPGDS